MHSILQLAAYWEVDPVTLNQAKLLSLAREGENAPGYFFDLFST